MAGKRTLTAVKAAVKNAVNLPTFRICVARARADDVPVCDNVCEQAGASTSVIASLTGMTDSETREKLCRLREKGEVYSVRSRVSEMTFLWWFEGLTDEIMEAFPQPEGQSQASVLMSNALQVHPAMTGDNPVVATHWNDHEKARVVMVAGENASGKSLVTKHLSRMCQEAGYDVCCASMRQRTSDSMFSSMVFGDERRMSTGQCSVRATLKAFEHARTTANPCVLILDEPDVGLSPELADVMGEMLAEELATSSDKLALLVVISHSRSLFKRMQAGMNPEPWSSLYVGKDRTFGQWLDVEPLPSSVDHLRSLPERSHDLYRKILETEKCTD